MSNVGRKKTNVPRGLGGNFSACPWEGFAAIRLCLGLHCSALLGLSRQIDQGPQGFPVWSREERGGMRSFWQPTSLDTACQGWSQHEREAIRGGGGEDPTQSTSQPLSFPGFVLIHHHCSALAAVYLSQGLIELLNILPKAGCIIHNISDITWCQAS